jgi:hypothetical protein
VFPVYGKESSPVFPVYGEIPTSAPPVHGKTFPWSAYGNLFLLDRPEKFALRVSRSATEAQIAALCKDTLEKASQHIVFVSPFISNGEKEIAKAILSADTGDVILLKHDGFPPLFKPKGRYFDLCCQGRLLILTSPILSLPEKTSSPVFPVHGEIPTPVPQKVSSPAPPAPPKVSSPVSPVYGGNPKLTRQTCLAMNAAAYYIANTSPIKT